MENSFKVQLHEESFVGKKNSHQVRHYSGSKESLYQIFQLLHYHIFWSCPLLISFWQEDYETLQKVLQVDI